MISNHDAVKECFSTNDKALAGRPRSSHEKYLVDNYAAFGFINYGKLWLKMRNITMLELLSSCHLGTLKNVQVIEIDNLIKDFYTLCMSKKHDNQAKVMISESIECLTFNIITKKNSGNRYFVNLNDGNGEAQRIGKLIKEFMYVSGVPAVSDLVPFLGGLEYFLGQVKSIKRIGRELDNLVGSWVDEHTMMRRAKNEQIDKPDFIDVMLSVIEDDGVFGHTCETIIKATALNLILGGSESTSLNLTWLPSILLNNKHALKQAQEELDLKVGRDRWVDDHYIKDLIYLQAIVKETLRLYPLAPLSIPHEAMQDCHICGYYVPKGTRVFVNVWKLRRDLRILDDPDKFFLERFFTKLANIDASGKHFEFVPFGSSRRSCPGYTFSLQVSQLILARLLQGFEFTTPLNIPPLDITEGLGITLTKACNSP